jgi:hypothetical protein
MSCITFRIVELVLSLGSRDQGQGKRRPHCSAFERFSEVWQAQ